MPLGLIQNTFAGNPLDRAGERRGDAAWVAEQLELAEARVAVLWNGSPLLNEARSSLALIGAPLAQDLADADGLLFLGLGEQGPVFALDLDDSADPTAGPLEGRGRFSDMRSAGALLPAPEAGIAATARAVFEWRRRHRFCSACGQRSETSEAGWRRICPACRTEHFPRTDAVVIMLPTLGDSCLLGRQAAWPEGRFSALAGFVEPGESLEEACARELQEEAALETLRVTYHSSQPWPFPTSLMIGLFAEVASRDAAPDQTELEEVRWLSREEARALLRDELKGMTAPPPLAIAHQLIRTWAG
jgi:NAD+ diphosphatase